MPDHPSIHMPDHPHPHSHSPRRRQQPLLLAAAAAAAVLLAALPASSAFVLPLSRFGASASSASAFARLPSEGSAVPEEERQPPSPSALRSAAASEAAAAAASSSISASSASSPPARAELQKQKQKQKQKQMGGLRPWGHGPAVLVGCSTEAGGDELRRLARSVAAPLGGTVVELGVGSGTVAEGPASEADLDGLVRGDVVVIDLGRRTTTEMAADSDDDDNDGTRTGTGTGTGTEADALLELASSLKSDRGWTSVYVNVRPDLLSPSSRALRDRAEETAILPATDYELAVTDEGLPSSYDDDAGGQRWEDVEWDLRRLLARAALPQPVPGCTDVLSPNSAHATMGRHTYFLSLSFPEIESVEEYLPQMCQDVDAMEFRADLLSCRDDRFELLRSLQWLRRACRPHAVRAPGLPGYGGIGSTVLTDVLPVVYTVRTANQAGTWPDDPRGISRMFDLLELGLRSGVEVCDVESAWDPDRTDRILALARDRYSTQILGSHHVVPDEVPMEEAIGYFRACHLGGRSHGAKVVLSIADRERDRMADDAGRIAQSMCRAEGTPVTPNISLILGEVGQYSRIVNERFTPVTHESLPFVAAPGQLSAREITERKVADGLLEPRRYAILGHSIDYSVSPQMHNAAFGATSLPHTYGRADHGTVEEFLASDLWSDPAFGGCSVTIPHKRSIMPHLDRLSEAAEAIGAVNTVTVAEEKDFDGSMRRVLLGDNTDWRGIYNPLKRRLGGEEEEAEVEEDTGGRVGVALILGGGGTARAAAYAASKLGLRAVHWNRTPARAMELAEEFGGTAVADLSEVEEGGLGEALSGLAGGRGSDIRAVISTLPAAAEFELPAWLVGRESGNSGSGPVVFDVNYKPATTKLLEQAEGAGLDVVRGSEMLWEQGVGQFQLWTGRTAPYGVMMDVVLDNCK